MNLFHEISELKLFMCIFSIYMPVDYEDKKEKEEEEEGREVERKVHKLD